MLEKLGAKYQQIVAIVFLQCSLLMMSLFYHVINPYNKIIHGTNVDRSFLRELVMHFYLLIFYIPYSKLRYFLLLVLFLLLTLSMIFSILFYNNIYFFFFI